MSKNRGGLETSQSAISVFDIDIVADHSHSGALAKSVKLDDM